MSFPVELRMDRQPLEGITLWNERQEDVQAYRYVLIVGGTPAWTTVETYIEEVPAFKMLLKGWLGIR